MLLQALGPAQPLESAAWAVPHHQTRGLRTLMLSKTPRTDLGASAPTPGVPLPPSHHGEYC